MSARFQRLQRALTHRLAGLVLALWPAAALASAPGTTVVATSAQIFGGSGAEIPVQRPMGMETPSPVPASRPLIPPTAAAPASNPAPTPQPLSNPQPTPGPDPSPGPDPTPEDPADPFPHAGAVADFRLGVQGCIGAFCRSSGHDVSPGIRLGGFLGGNIRGWFEMGLGVGWGTMKPTITPGTNALVLYGLDPGVLQQALAAQAAGLLQVDLAGLAVQDARSRVLQVGPSMRVHVVPRGRFDAFVGAGVGYSRLRTLYQTGVGEVGLDFHGVDIPVEANVSVYVLRNLAVGVQFDYMWTWYGLAVLDHPQQQIAMPLGVLQAAARQQGVDLRGQLPQLWTVGLALRGRL